MSRFWNTPAMAGPTSWNVFRFWDRTPRYLRMQTRPTPPPFTNKDITWTTPEHLTITEAAELTHFLNRYYRGEDWVLEVQEEWIEQLLSEPTTTALGVRNELGNLVGSLVCRSIGKNFKIGKAVLPTAYVIEGLCIHPSWRGKHLAGWLIAWIDHLQNTEQPHAFFWSREASPRDTTYVASHTYAYMHLTKCTERMRFTEIPWVHFRNIWQILAKWWSIEYAAFPTILPIDPMRVWRCEEHKDVYIVISDTRRRTVGSGAPIWEVQFVGSLYAPIAKGSWREMLEAVGNQYLQRGILFVSSAPWQGGAVASWPAPWRYGTAGVHTTYIYNFMPPTFHNLATLFLRNEL